MWRRSTNVADKLRLFVDHGIIQPHRCSSGASTSGGGVLKALLWSTGLVTVGTGGALGYAWYDPEFRRNIENTVPQSKDTLQQILGDPRDTTKPLLELPPSLKQVADKISSATASIMPSSKEQKEQLASPVSPAPSSAKTTVKKEKAPAESVPKTAAPSAEKSETKTKMESEKAKTDAEDETREKLRRQAAAHSENLEDALRAQQSQLESKYRQQLDEVLQKQREKFNDEIGSAIGRLQAIDAALEGRVEQDNENRRAKELWLACQQFKKSVLQGRTEGIDYSARKKPLGTEVAAIKHAGTSDPFVKALLSSVTSDALSEGVFTQDDLLNRFEKVKKVCNRTALIGDSGGTLFQYFLSTVQSWFLFHWVKPNVSQLQQIDPSSANNVDILWRASYFVDQLDFATAVKLLLLLKGEPARLASDWVKAAQLHLETRRAAELLMAHASALSMRTIY